MADKPAFPRLCRIKSLPTTDTLLCSAAGLHGWAASVALAVEDGGRIRVVISAAGETALVEPSVVSYDLAADVAMDIMDALEEAIEDALDNLSGDRMRANALEATLALFDSCLGEI